MPKRLPALALLAACCLAMGSAGAAVRTWNAAGTSGLWSDPANWLEGVAPTNGDHLVFQNAPSHVSQNDLGALSLDGLEFHGQFFITGSDFTITRAAAFVSDIGVLIVPHITLSAPNASISVAGGGDLQLTNGVTVNGGTFTISVPDIDHFTLAGAVTEMSATSMSVTSRSGANISIADAEVSGSVTLTGPTIAVGPGTMGHGAGPVIFNGNNSAATVTVDSGQAITRLVSARLTGPDSTLVFRATSGNLTYAGGVEIIGEQHLVSDMTLTGPLQGTGSLTVSSVLYLGNTANTIAGSIEVLGGGDFGGIASNVFPASATVVGDAGSRISLGAFSQSVTRFDCAGTLYAAVGGLITASQRVVLSACALDLSATPPSYVVPNTDIPLLVTTGSTAVSGTFAGLPEGAPIRINGVTRYITYRGGDGNDVMLLVQQPPTDPDLGSLQDMWWNPTESGWGMSLIQHNDGLFAALYIYDSAGNPTWVVMPNGSWDSSHTIYSGAIYEPKGTPFYNYDAQRLQIGTALGSLTITFHDANNATLDYTIRDASGNDISGTKFVTREIFANGPATPPDHTDLWWGGFSQNGWGITVLQQGDTLFSVWFTYDANGNRIWYVMPGGAWTASDTYEGSLYRTAGPPWLGKTYDQSKLQVINSGTYKFQFNSGGATFTYNADGFTGSIPLVREPF
jgi:hypothetical protein